MYTIDVEKMLGEAEQHTRDHTEPSQQLVDDLHEVAEWGPESDEHEIAAFRAWMLLAALGRLLPPEIKPITIVG